MPKIKNRHCNLCGKTFKRHQYLADHKKDYHSDGPKEIKCPIPGCNYETNRLGNYNLHLQKHGINFKVKKCLAENCSKKFKNEENLVKHMKICRLKPEFKTLKCYCGAEVLTQEGLGIHKKLCHGIKNIIPEKPCNEEVWKELMKIEDLIYFL